MSSYILVSAFRFSIWVLQFCVLYFCIVVWGWEWLVQAWVGPVLVFLHSGWGWAVGRGLEEGL